MTLDEFNHIKKLHTELQKVNEIIKACKHPNKRVEMYAKVSISSVIAPETFYLSDMADITEAVLNLRKEFLETTLLELGLEV